MANDTGEKMGTQGRLTICQITPGPTRLRGNTRPCHDMLEFGYARVRVTCRDQFEEREVTAEPEMALGGE